MYFEKLVPIYLAIFCIVSRTRGQHLPWVSSTLNSQFQSGKGKRLHMKPSPNLEQFEPVFQSDFDSSLSLSPTITNLNAIHPYYLQGPNLQSNTQGQMQTQPYQQTSYSTVSKRPFNRRPNRLRNPQRQDIMQKKQTQMMPMCDGQANLLDDFGIISLIIGTVSTLIGFTIDLVLTLMGNFISFLGTLISVIFAIPNAIIGALGLSGDFIYYFSNGLNVLGFAASFFGSFSVDIGNVGLITGLFFEFLGIIGLIISVITSFPELFNDMIEFGELFGFGDELHFFINNYGCHNPYEAYNESTIDYLLSYF